jgi:membrane protease YdiL (CAAX protease family)
MNTVFINSYGRLRSGWRAAVFGGAFIFFEMGWYAVIVAFFGAPGDNRSSLLLWGVDLLFGLVLATGLGWICGRALEGLPFKALGWAVYRGWFKHLLLGLLTGALSLIFACLICVVFGRMSFGFNETADLSQTGTTLAVAGVFFLLGAASEEAIFRGYLMQTFTRAKLAWVAILIASLFFAAAHLANPGASPIAFINTMLAGFWFSAAYLKTRSLWLPLGAHFAWNWFQGAIFGIPVSGITRVTAAPLLQQADSGPAWLTGGSYGIEGGLACTITLVLSTVLIYFWPGLKADEEMLALTSHESVRD